MFYTHPLVIPQTLEARKYQMNILETIKAKNTLIVLPTGMGKTPLAIMLAAERLEDFPDSKVLIVAPTKPLCAQHEKSFRDILDFPKKQIALLTGQIPASNRYFYYKNCRVISATPQTIQNDLKTGTLNLKDFSLLIVDEVHRAVHGYAYPFVAKKYMEQAINPRVIGLTASPGGTEERINHIRRNLFSEAVEIRTEHDPDVKSYVQKTEVETIKVDLGKNLEYIQGKLKGALNNKLSKLRAQNIRVYTKQDVIMAQQRFSKLLQTDKRPIFFHIVSWCAEAIKIWHAVQLAETQSIYSLEQYFERLAKKQDKSSQRIILNMRDVIEKIKETEDEHPKIIMLKILVREELKKNKNSKIIVFSHFRDNIDKIKQELSKLDGCRPIALIGQSGEKGLKQKEQIDLIKDYNADVYNVLLTTSIGEEGLHISSADMAVFYEPVGSEIRSIQRRGRVGRTKLGRVIILVTKKTSDEHRHYASQRKEKKMKQVLEGMRDSKNRGLNKWL
jgi:ERCC4-related helicase